MKEYYYCQSSPFSLTTKYYEVDVKMKAFIMSWESKRTGFVVGFVAYTDGMYKVPFNLSVRRNRIHLYCFTKGTTLAIQ